MSLQEVALSCIARGWYVFPCWPESKKPMTVNGWYDASIAELLIRAWWTKTSNANVAIATQQSKLTVWDCDYGFTCRGDFEAFAVKHNIPRTYGVRSGRRDSFGVQLYFTGEQIPSNKWVMDGCSGDFRSNTGYVMAEGSIHDKTGETYEALWNYPLQDLPEIFRDLKKPEPVITTPSNGELDVLRIGLEAVGISYEDKDNKLYVSCPWAHEHSGYSGPSETALFVRNGWYCFKCQHSSCSGRTYGQYRDEVFKR